MKMNEMRKVIQKIERMRLIAGKPALTKKQLEMLGRSVTEVECAELVMRYYTPTHDDVSALVRAKNTLNSTISKLIAA